MMKQYGSFPTGYTLIDAGGGLKLERWGEYVTIRPEHQAYFKSALPHNEWRKLADFEFYPVSEGSLNGTWKALKQGLPTEWALQSGSCIFNLALTSNKHVGLFPEQQIHWNELVQLTPQDRFLNLFAYTGAASCFARTSGAQVTHVDSVKAMNEWGKKNMESSNLQDIRWIQDDALKFAEKELKRGNTYTIIQMDPPAWGMGAKKEKWKLENLLPELLQTTVNLLAPGGKIILNTYSPKITLKDLENQAKHLQVKHYEVFELWLKTEQGNALYYGNVLHLYS